MPIAVCNAARLLSFLGNPFYSIPFPYLQFYYITSYASTYPPVFLQSTDFSPVSPRSNLSLEAPPGRKRPASASDGEGQNVRTASAGNTKSKSAFVISHLCTGTNDG